MGQPPLHPYAVDTHTNLWMKRLVLCNLNFLHPQLPANLYGYPQHKDLMEVDPSDILTLVSPSTAIGCRYHLPAKEVTAATRALEPRA